MNKNWGIYLFVFLFLVQLTTATTIYTGTTDVVTIKDVSKVYNFTIKNPNSFDIFNVSFSPVQDFTFPTFSAIAPNTTVTGEFTVLTNSSYSLVTNSKLSYTKLEQSTVDPVIRNVQISTTQISPNALTMFQGDTIKFSNTDTVNLTVKERNNAWQVFVPAQGIGEITLSAEGSLEYYIAETGFLGNITVNSKSQPFYVHDPTTDVNLLFNVTSLLGQANMGVTVLTETTLTIPFNGTFEGALQLTSDAPVYNVKLTSSKDWITFSQQSFDFTTSKVIVFTIDPLVGLTNETNISYPINIFVTSDNTPQQTSSFSVFIPHASIEDFAMNLNVSAVSIATTEQLIAFCLTNPQYCPKTNITQIVLQNVTTNLSLEISEIRQILERNSNAVNTISDAVGTQGGKVDTLETSISDVNQALLLQAEEDRKDRNLRLLVSIVFFVSCLIFVAVVGVIFAYYWYQRYQRVREQEIT